jgi:MOSC domain-containing protein YiiM
VEKAEELSASPPPGAFPETQQGTVRAIYVAAAVRAPMRPLTEVRAVVDRGLEGDRYFNGAGSFSRWPGSGRAVTLIEAEAIEATRAQFGIDLSDGRSRRNVVTSGIRLAELNGRKFRVGTALFRGTRECAPCKHLERLTEPGVEAALKGRGGLRAEILEGGVIRVGDVIQPVT